MMTSVVHCKRNPFDVFIGRPSKWGNPFHIGVDGSRLEVVQKHAHWIAQPEQRELFLSIPGELGRKRLGCFCAPKLCHGHVYAAIADGQASILVDSGGTCCLSFLFYMCEDCEGYIPFGPNGVLVHKGDGTLKTVCLACASRYKVDPGLLLT